MDKLALLEEFEKYYSPSQMKGTYRKGIVAVIKVRYQLLRQGTSC